MTGAWARLVEKKGALFAIIALWLCIEFILLGPFSAMPIFDYADSWIPVQHALKTNLVTHGVTSWFPAMGTGVDRLAQDHFYCYLPNLLALALPIWLSNPIAIFLQYFLAMVFVFRICKEQLNISDAGSVLAGVLFAVFCEFNPMLFGVYAFPLILYYFEKMYRVRRPLRAAGGIIGLGVATAVGSLVIYLPYTLPILAAWFLCIRRIRDARCWALLALYGLVVVACKIPSLMAIWLNAAGSQRDFLIPGHATMNAAFYQALVKRTLPWLVPSWLHVVLLGCGIWWSRLKDRQYNIFLGFLCATTIGAFGLNLLKFTAHLSLAGYQLDRFFLVSPLFYAIGIAYAFRYIPTTAPAWARSRSRVISFRVVAVAVAVASIFAHTLVIKVAHAKAWVRHGSYAANFASPVIRDLAERTKREAPFRVATAVGLIFPTYAMAYGLESSDGYANLYPLRYKQFWSRVIRPLTAGNPRLDAYFNHWGNRIYLFPPTAIPGPDIRFADYYNLDLLSLANTRYIVSRSRLIDDRLTPVHEPAEEFYRLPRRAQTRLRVRENFGGNTALFVYENRAFLPRFFVADTVRAFASDTALLDALAAADHTTLRRTVFVQGADLPAGELGVRKADIRMAAYAPDAITLNVTLDGRGVLIVSNAWSPYWKVTINGRPGKIIPADHTFWGVLLEAGAQQVRFTYDPPYKVL